MICGTPTFVSLNGRLPMWSKYLIPANFVVMGTPLFFGGVAMIQDDWIGLPVALIGLALFIVSYLFVLKDKNNSY